jgi:hypothetical protein
MPRGGRQTAGERPLPPASDATTTRCGGYPGAGLGGRMIDLKCLQDIPPWRPENTWARYCSVFFSWDDQAPEARSCSGGGAGGGLRSSTMNWRDALLSNLANGNRSEGAAGRRFHWAQYWSRDTSRSSRTLTPCHDHGGTVSHYPGDLREPTGCRCSLLRCAAVSWRRRCSAAGLASGCSKARRVRERRRGLRVTWRVLHALHSRVR